MKDDWQKQGFNPNLQKQDSLLSQNRNRKDALTAESEIVDVGYLTGDLIVEGAVTEAKIADLAVTTNKIANNAVTSGKIAPEAVDSSDIAGSAVDGTHIADNTITNLNIGNYDLAKGTGLWINPTNSGTSGTWIATAEFSANGTAGLSAIATILDAGTITHTLTFTYGLLTNYGTS